MIGAESLTNFQIAAWGVVGAAGSLVVVYVIPFGYGLARGRINLRVTIGRVFGVVIILAATLFLGALAPFVIGSTEIKTAVSAGLAYQSSLAGAAEVLRG